MLSKVKLQNFKCIENVELELAPLTVFLGENGSGKSSVMQALSFLKQGRGKAPLHCYEGELVRLGNFTELVHKGEEERWISIRIDIKPSEEESQTLWKLKDNLPWEFLPWGCEKNLDQLVEDLPEHRKEIGYEVSIRGNQEIKHRAIIKDETLIEVGYIRENGLLRKKVLQPEGDLEWSGLHDKLPGLGFSEIFQVSKVKTGESYAYNFSEPFLQTVMKRLENTCYISAIRGDVPREGRIHKNSPFVQLKRRGEKGWVGVHGEYTLDLLSTIFKVAKPRIELRQKRERIAKWAGEFGIKDLEAGLTGEADDKGAIISSTFLDPESNSILNPASSGGGSRQLLPIITQLFYSDSEDTIMIEEPEISLHVKGQRKLLEMFSEAISEGKQIILTTHSEHLPLALRTVIPSGKLNSKDVAIYHFERDEETGAAKAQRLPLSPRGVIKDWIPSYVDAEREEIREYMNTIPEA